MKLNEESLKFIYENINAFLPINLIVSNYKTTTIKRYNTIDFPDYIKAEELELTNKIVEGLSSRDKKVVYHIESNKTLKYMGFGVFEGTEYEGAIILGPYLHEVIPGFFIQESERFVYEEIPVISRTQQKALSNITSTLINNERIESIAIKVEDRKLDTRQLNYTLDDYQMNLVGIKEMYKEEKELLYYIGQGNKEKALELVARDDYHKMERINRFPDNPMRNLKNLGIVFNTLLRKSIESSGVDEYFIHTISENFAVRIEKIMTSKEINTLMTDMIIEYCNLVNEYNTRVYSELVAKAITYIKLNFKQELGLASIAKELFIHPTYLAKKFKQETSQTVSEYVNQVRIKEAQFMLKATEFKVEDIAYYVGYNDKKYFSKTFKKAMGTSPSEYRQYNKTEHK